jgi:hypothetical protein
MTETPRSFRLPPQLWQAIQDATRDLADSPQLALLGTVTVALVVRLALAEGLQVLREKYGAATEEPGRKAPARPAKPKGRK